MVARRRLSTPCALAVAVSLFACNEADIRQTSPDPLADEAVLASSHAVRRSETNRETADDTPRRDSASADAEQADDAPSIAKASTRARLQYEQNTIEVFRAAAPATVFVTRTKVVRDRWSARALEVPTGSGSGFVWDRDGHIVTNAHVVASRARRPTYSVTLYDGESYSARLIGADPQKDIAVLKVDAPKRDLAPISLPAARSRPEVGSKALAIGNPFGLDHTLTVGVVSALGREVKGFGQVTIRGMIQTDASINPGNSGGPLLDSAGRLLGMNTIIFSKSGSSAGIGFAVPVTIIRRVVPQIIKYGHSLRVGLGVSVVDDAVAQANGIRGVVIRSVSPKSGAAKAGLRGLQRGRRGDLVGDVIIGINEEKVDTFDDLYNSLENFKPGDTVKVIVRRKKDKVRVPVVLTEIHGEKVDR